METRVFREEDVDEINGWLKARKGDAVCEPLLSRTGYIVPGIACGFLYATDSRVCILDYYVTNPDALAASRKDALDDITRRLLEVAKSRGYLLILANSIHKTIQDRCLRFGFKPHGAHEVYSMEIK